MLSTKLSPAGVGSGAPFFAVGTSIPVISARVGNRSVMCWYCRRISPRAPNPSGQCTMKGTWWPPWWVLILYIRSGVFETIAHPSG